MNIRCYADDVLIHLNAQERSELVLALEQWYDQWQTRRITADDNVVALARNLTERLILTA